jgi:N-acetylmuramoyl-L-alanine amidase
MTPAILCLATAVFFEGRSEPVAAQVAIAEVIVNRVYDARYPDDVCKVVYEPWQFSFANNEPVDLFSDQFDNIPDQRAIGLAFTIAEEVLSSTPEVTSTHYHTTSVSPSWSTVFTLDGKLGNHLFFTNETPYR